MPRHITYRGRVIYRRAKHFFTKADNLRINKSLLARQGKSEEALLQLVDELTIGMLRILLDQIGLGQFARIIQNFGRDLINYIVLELKRILGDLPPEFMAEIDKIAEKTTAEAMEGMPTGL